MEIWASCEVFENKNSLLCLLLLIQHVQNYYSTYFASSKNSSIKQDHEWFWQETKDRKELKYIHMRKIIAMAYQFKEHT